MQRLGWIAGVLLVAGGCQIGTAEKTCDAPRELTVDYRVEPCGVTSSAPRFAWKMGQGLVGGKKDVRQTAYRVLVASSLDKLAKNDGDLWDSGLVETACSMGVEYAGQPLASSRRYWWKVQTVAGCGRTSAWSRPQSFLTGLMAASDWQAKWIGPAACTRPDEDFGAARWITAPANAKGVTTLAYSFDFDGVKPGECVEMVHAGVSQHEIDVNGREFNKWSGSVHDWRYLRFRDLTPWLVKGRNTVTVRVFADEPRKPGDPIDPIRLHAAADVRAFLAKIVFPDGRTLVTDRAWTSPQGPVDELGAVRDTAWGKAMVLRAENASPAFAKTFEVKKPVASAVLHVTGVGFYEASLNGAKIGRKVLDPSPTAFDKRVLYSTYDLSQELKAGANELKILVGHGWYDMRAVATWNFETTPWRNFPRTIAQLEITYADGTTERVMTDGSWRQVRSPLGYDDLFEGEVTGAWNARHPDLETAAVMAEEVPGPGGRLVSEMQPGAQVMRTIRAKRVKDCGNGTYVIDFGENLSGWMRAKVRGQRKGDVVSFRYEERVGDDLTPARESVRDGLHEVPKGSINDRYEGAAIRRIDVHFRYTASQRVCPVDAAFQTDRFVCSGAAEEAYEPRFQYSGFRYVVARGLAQAPEADAFEACVIHTAFPTIGAFSCSDPTFNKLMEMGDKAYRSNFTDGVPTDCPHREKNGWTGDASIGSELAQYLYENTAAYEKWLRDILDAQLPDGNIPGIVPSSGWGYKWGNGPAWDSALPVIAWNLWCYRGDRRILDELYPALVKYLAYTATRADANGLVKHGLGDWVPVNRKHMPSTELTSSCYYYQAQRIAAEIAGLKGLADEAKAFNVSAEKTRAGIHAKFYRGNGVYDNGGQTAQAFPLAFGVVPAGERAAVEARLAAAVEAADGHVDMGLLGTKHVFRALSRMGRTDLAWKMLTNPTKPSPVEWVQKGGTTLWEDWGDGASRNHIMFGDFVGWAYQYLMGIQLSEAAGSTSAVPVVEPGAQAFAKIVLAPQPIAGLEWARARVNGPYGKIVSAWRREGKANAYEFVVPPNTTATIRLPGQPDRTVGSGRHVFTVER